MSDNQKKVCGTCGFWICQCFLAPEDQANESVPPDAVASRCSHGGDNAVEIAARSHDSALEQERREFWKARYTFIFEHFTSFAAEDAANGADLCLEEFDKRFIRDR